MIQALTRPNNGGSCLDWIVTNSDFVNKPGVLSIYISDHFPVFCIRKKKRESLKYVYRTCRDLLNYNSDNFFALIRNIDWTQFHLLHKPDEMWNFLFGKSMDILSVMCPMKSYKQRENVTPWIMPDIYRAMRNRDKYVSLFHVTGCNYY